MLGCSPGRKAYASASLGRMAVLHVLPGFYVTVHNMRNTLCGSDHAFPSAPCRSQGVCNPNPTGAVVAAPCESHSYRRAKGNAYIQSAIGLSRKQEWGTDQSFSSTRPPLCLASVGICHKKTSGDSHEYNAYLIWVSFSCERSPTGLIIERGLLK